MKQKTITIRHQVPKAKEGKYYSIPFEVPEGVESMRIRYTYPKAQKAIVDLGLMDNQGRFIGWSGSARNEITVGPYDATPGYWMTRAEKGSWQILVGAYHIPADPLPVTYEITYLMPDARWLAGDLHVHSTASDGKLSPYELGMLARKRGLDFLAIADHNNFCENFALPKIPGLTLIPAVEWTHYKGHMNFFGIKAPFDQSFVANDIDEMRTLIQQAKNKGALISVNHPKCPRCPYLWEDDTIFDLVEIWNGPMRKANTDAILWWHQMLLSGRKMPIVGGSDFHRTLRISQTFQSNHVCICEVGRNRGHSKRHFIRNKLCFLLSPRAKAQYRKGRLPVWSYDPGRKRAQMGVHSQKYTTRDGTSADHRPGCEIFLQGKTFRENDPLERSGKQLDICLSESDPPGRKISFGLSNFQSRRI